MKKSLITLLLVLSVISLVSCNQNANNNDIIIEIGDSSKFTEEEINTAVEVVINNFKFTASTLIKVIYNEEKSEELTKLYLENGKGAENGAKAENVIVLLSNFYVDNSGDNPVLNPGSTYEDYQWILIRDNEKSGWMIDDAGY